MKISENNEFSFEILVSVSVLYMCDRRTVLDCVSQQNTHSYSIVTTKKTTTKATTTTMILLAASPRPQVMFNNCFDLKPPIHIYLISLGLC